MIGVIARHTDAALENISRKLTTGSLVNAGTDENNGEDDEDGVINFDETEGDDDGRADNSRKSKSKVTSNSTNRTGKKPVNGILKNLFRSKSKAEIDDDIDGRKVEVSGSNVFAEKKSDIITCFRKLETVEEEAILWYDTSYSNIFLRK